VALESKEGNEDRQRLLELVHTSTPYTEKVRDYHAIQTMGGGLHTEKEVEDTSNKNCCRMMKPSLAAEDMNGTDEKFASEDQMCSELVEANEHYGMTTFSWILSNQMHMAIAAADIPPHHVAEIERILDCYEKELR
jgi:hypothetical protein